MEFIKKYMIEFGLLPYKPGPWATQQWDDAYGSEQLEYFSNLNESGRYSIISGYLEYVTSQVKQEPIHILDIGCGNGLLYDRTKHINYTSWMGVDLSEVAIQQAQDLVKPIPDRNILFVVGNLLDPQFTIESKKYSVIIFNEVLYMSNDPDEMLRQASLALAHEGYILVSGWRHRGDSQLWRKIENYFAKVHSYDIQTENHPIAPRGWKVSLYK